jgi:hypothetical protein
MRKEKYGLTDVNLINHLLNNITFIQIKTLFIFNYIFKKEYIHYETYYFDKNTNLFLKEKPRHWK